MSDPKDLVNTPDQDLSHLVKKEGDLGTDNISQADLILPRLKIVQALTKEKFGANPGECINGVSGLNYGKEVEAVPIVYWKSNIMFDKTLGVVCRSYDSKVSADGKDCAECGKFRFDKEGNKPLCNKIHNYLVGVRKDIQDAITKGNVLDPLVLSFMSTGTKEAKKFNTCIRLNSSKKYPIYSEYFKFIVPETPEKFPAGEAFLMTVSPIDYVSAEEVAYLEGVYNEFSKMKLDTKITEEDVDTEVPTDDV